MGNIFPEDYRTEEHTFIDSYLDSVKATQLLLNNDTLLISSRSFQTPNSTITLSSGTICKDKNLSENLGKAEQTNTLVTNMRQRYAQTVHKRSGEKPFKSYEVSPQVIFLFSNTWIENDQ